MAFTYNIPNLLNSLKLRQSTSVVRDVTNLLTTTDKAGYQEALRGLTESYFLKPIQDLTQVDEFLIAGGSFNLPVFAPLIIEIPEEVISKKVSDKQAKYLEDHPFLTELAGTALGFRLDGVAITVSRSKNIVTTAIQGRDYTIKEFISNGDHEITIEGVLASHGTGYPASQVVQLRKLFDRNEPLKITNALLQRMGIFELVVTSYEFPSNEGLRNIQPFSFNALSEEPVEMKKENAEKHIKLLQQSFLKNLVANF